ncbi:hypothetical protein DNTS_021723 [Danionella cerebrum]|uniref:Ependymin-like 1 n=1 Tax=Danionella cerebrum TaxID=2873325 RepID=A0A553NJ95_9TELE|nr:hypothetical protein DNTS_021723 [Danionella translucida]
MKLLVSVGLFLITVSSAQKPHPCRAPPLMTGSLTVSAGEGKDWVVAKYSYDAFGQRIHLREFGQVQNKSFYLNMLFLYREAVVYTIDFKNQTCTMQPLESSFHPTAIPQNASFMTQLLRYAERLCRWRSLCPIHRTTPGNPEFLEELLLALKSKYIASVTEFGCLPVSTLYYTEQTGWVTTTYFNTVKGIENPEQFIPPPFCEGVKMQEEPMDFFSAFL